MLLVGADEQSGGESGKTVLAGNFGGSGQSQPETMLAAFSFMSYNCSQIVDKVITLRDEQWEVYSQSQSLHGLQTTLVFLKWVDIGVIPQRRHLIVLMAQMFYRVGGAGATAGVKQQSSHLNHQRLP